MFSFYHRYYVCVSPVKLYKNDTKTQSTKETLKSCYTFSHFKIRSALSKANTEKKLINR